ncbi:SRPBCC family protein [Aromatoleum evansii]|uniref:SRPBCC family protein n=1 Tax=Aromatoleum evansii TaxID=59406 RepID=A0ABZ1AKD5_AROEV|nr:SRPBCC family protein [Aromatoleum evansii]
MFRLLRCLPIMLALSWGQGTAALEDAAAVADKDVRVERNVGGFTVDMLAHAPVNQALAWEVLTDFEHMAAFVPNLKTSRVSERGDAFVRVHQTGTARYGMFWTNFESVREIRFSPPNEIRAQGVGGNMKRMESVMRLEAEPGGTLLRYHAEVQPDVWLPPLLGPSFVRHETAEQFSAIIREMVRRQ